MEKKKEKNKKNKQAKKTNTTERVVEKKGKKIIEKPQRGDLADMLFAIFDELRKDHSILPHKISMHVIEAHPEIKENTIRNYLSKWRALRYHKEN